MKIKQLLVCHPETLKSKQLLVCHPAWGPACCSRTRTTWIAFLTVSAGSLGKSVCSLSACSLLISLILQKRKCYQSLHAL